MVDSFDAGKAGCSASAFEAAAYDPQEKGAAKRAFAAARVRNFARTPTMTFVDEGLEAEYVHWQARQRWQVWPSATLGATSSALGVIPLSCGRKSRASRSGSILSSDSIHAP